jgi:predicted neuraminidase
LLNNDYSNPDKVVRIKFSFNGGVTKIVDTFKLGTSTEAIAIEYQNQTAIEEVASKTHEISIYPNPTQNQLFINCNKSNIKASLFTMTGQLVLNVNLIENNNGLDLSNLKSGIYVLHLNGPEFNKTLQIIKN